MQVVGKVLLCFTYLYLTCSVVAAGIRFSDHGCITAPTDAALSSRSAFIVAAEC